MPRLPSRTPKDIARLLIEHGFVLVRSRGSHAIYNHSRNDRVVVIPMHVRDLPKGTLHDILNQAGLSKDDL